MAPSLRGACRHPAQWTSWHPKGNFIIGGSGTGTVYMWDVPGGNMSYFGGHSVRVLIAYILCRDVHAGRHHLGHVGPGRFVVPCAPVWVVTAVQASRS